MNKVVCIIPARSGSKEIKNKNIKKFKKKPLIFYTIDFAKKLSFVDKIILSTDSKKYLNIANKFYNFGKKLRPKKFAKDKSKAIDYVNYELKNLENLKNYKYLLLLQPTCPFRKKSDFEKAFKIIKSNKCDTIISSKLVKEHPLLMHTYNNRVKFLTKNYKKAFSGRQGFPKIYLRQGAMYLTKISTLKKFNSLQGGIVKHIIVRGKYAVNIDDKEDLISANYYFKKKL
jgi:CMP-N-acetylneuraminic acid synthetase